MSHITLAQIGFSIRNQVKGFFSSDDERIDIEFIYKKVKDARSLLIREEYKQYGRVAPELYQEICCLEIECRELECQGEKSGIIEKYVKVPALENLGSAAIKYFGSPDHKTPFNYRNYQGHLYGNASRWTGQDPYFTPVGHEFIIGNFKDDDMKVMCMVALLEDPLNGGCYTITENDDFPVSQSMVHKIELIIIKQLMSTLGVLPDTKNNASNSPMEDMKGIQQKTR